MMAVAPHAPHAPYAPPVAAPLQVEAVLDLVLASAGRLFEGDSGSIMLRTDVDELEVVASPANPKALGARVRFGQGVAGQVAATGDAVLVSGRAAGRWKPVDSGLSVPLIDNGDLFGVLNVNARPVRLFTDFDLLACTAFAAHAAHALVSARRYELDRLDGRDRLGRHLADLLRHLEAAASVDFVAPGDREVVNIAAIARSITAVEVAAGRPVAVQGPVSAFVIGRSRELRRLLQELIDNAHRHGGAPVRVLIDDAGAGVSVTISDGGSGIAEADRALACRPYGRLERGTDGAGLGLGFTIAQRLAAGLGATLEIVDHPVGGARLQFHLPA